VVVVLKHSAGFIKRFARLPSKDRKKILKVLKKQERKRNTASKASKETTTSTSTSTNTSNASVNKEWEHWVVLHDKKENVAEDVREIGKTLGVYVTGDKFSGLNLLTKEGRRELRAERGSMLEVGTEVEGGSVREGV